MPDRQRSKAKTPLRAAVKKSLSNALADFDIDALFS
jgi:hypothetical protein